MIATFLNAASVLSIGVFFSLMVSGLAGTLPHAMYSGLTAQGVPAASASQISGLPPIGVLFASFLGYNPMQQLLGPVLAHMPAAHAAFLTGRQFFPDLISTPFHDGLGVAFGFALGACVLGAIFSAMTGKPKPQQEHESLGSELAAAELSAAGEPSELVIPDMVPDGEPAQSTTGQGKES